MQNFSTSFRRLLRNWRFSLFTVLVMAIGLGLSIYVLSYVNTLLFKSAPFENSASLIEIVSIRNGDKSNVDDVNSHDYQYIKQRQQSLADFGAVLRDNVKLDNGNTSRRLSAAYVSFEMFDWSSTEPIIGRSFNQDDQVPGASPVVIIGYNIWQNLFISDSNVIGSTVVISGVTHTIVGVMPKDFYFPDSQQLWLPLPQESGLKPGEGSPVQIFARLKNNVSLAQATQEINGLSDQIGKASPQTNEHIGTRVAPFGRVLVEQGGLDVVLQVTLVGSVLLLLFSCANIGSMLLARFSGRVKEVAIFAALGANRKRLLMSLLTEAVIICLLGTLLGLMFSNWGMKISNMVQRSILEDQMPFWWELRLDATTLLIALLGFVVTSLVTGLYPAWRVSGASVNEVLKDGAKGMRSKTDIVILQGLVLFEIVASFVLLTIAGVFVAVVMGSINLDLGTAKEDYIVVGIAPPDTYESPAQANDMYLQVAQKLKAISTVEGVAITSARPGKSSTQVFYHRPEATFTSAKDLPRTSLVVASPGYFELMSRRIIEGRDFDSSDSAESQPVAVIDVNLANKIWPQDSAIGKQLVVGEGEDTLPLTVVGVVEHLVQTGDVDMAEKGSIYMPLAQDFGSPYVFIMVKTQQAAAHLSAQAHDAVYQVEKDALVYYVRDLEQLHFKQSADLVYFGSYFLVFAIAAVLLASSGIYSIKANDIVSRTAELGVRRALGTTDSAIIKMFIYQGLKTLIVGAVVGLPLAYFASQQLAELGLSASNWLILPLVFLLIAVIILVATLVPALASLRITLSNALRYE